MPDPRRPGRPLGRRVGFRTPRKTLVVWCEGELTEPDYLQALKRLPEIRERGGRDPGDAAPNPDAARPGPPSG